jgi:hypothetical protein
MLICNISRSFSCGEASQAIESVDVECLKTLLRDCSLITSYQMDSDNHSPSKEEDEQLD